jgi:hypothetical protein
MPDIAASVFRSVEAERFAADESNRFRLRFAEVHRRGVGVREFFVRRVVQNTGGDFMKRRLVRNRCDGVDGELSTCGKALDVAVHFVKLRARDVQKYGGRRPSQSREWVTCPLPPRPFAPWQTDGRETRTWTASLLPLPRRSDGSSAGSCKEGEQKSMWPKEGITLF